MERVLSDVDKIRKAEEIYYRRNNKNNYMGNNLQKNVKPKTYFLSKIMLDLLVLSILAVTVFSIKNKNYIFTEQFLEKISSYNINITEILKNWLAEDKNTTSTDIIENSVSETQNENIEEKTEENFNNVIEGTEETRQEEISFIKPLEGIISSNFGAKESKYQYVRGSHTGIDIAADSGIIIKAAISGIVEQVSSEGDYGNHVKITKDNTSTLYAHCEEIFVSEGQEIIQGQEIASVGSTGNSTGPHLHFEIRIDNNPIDPSSVIEF